jgi:hypothetical protein
MIHLWCVVVPPLAVVVVVVVEKLYSLANLRPWSRENFMTMLFSPTILYTGSSGLDVRGRRGRVRRRKADEANARRPSGDLCRRGRGRHAAEEHDRVQSAARAADDDDCLTRLEDSHAQGKADPFEGGRDVLEGRERVVRSRLFVAVRKGLRSAHRKRRRFRADDPQQACLLQRLPKRSADGDRLRVRRAPVPPSRGRSAHQRNGTHGCAQHSPAH